MVRTYTAEVLCLVPLGANGTEYSHLPRLWLYPTNLEVHTLALVWYDEERVNRALWTTSLVARGGEQKKSADYTTLFQQIKEARHYFDMPSKPNLNKVRSFEVTRALFVNVCTKLKIHPNLPEKICQ